MNKAELIEALVKETEMTKAAAGRTIDALVQIITKTVAKKEDVQLIGIKQHLFCKFRFWFWGCCAIASGQGFMFR